MTDSDKGEPGMAEEALNMAKGAVDSASSQVDEVGRRVSVMVDSARRPETYVELLRSATLAAPIGMLVTAFIAGAIFGSSRRRRY